MKLIDKTALVAEIEKYYNESLKRAKITDSDYWNAKADAYRNVLAILNDTLEVKEVEEPSKDLEEAADNYVGHAPEIDEDLSCFTKRKAFIAGAQWQKERIKLNL